MKVLKSNRGDMMIGVTVIILISMFVVAFAMRVYPVFIAKQQLDTYATELCRVAAISGQVGDETNSRMQKLNETYSLSPSVSWSKTGKLQLDDEITVECSTSRNIGLFGGIGSFPVTIKGRASGRSEVYWK
jgi:hypothetical protein